MYRTSHDRLIHLINISYPKTILYRRAVAAAVVVTGGEGKYPCRRLVSSFTWTFFGRASDMDDCGAGGVGCGDRGNDGHLRSVSHPLVHSLTHSPLSPSRTLPLSLSLVSILSPLCVLLIYRAAGKCLRHSPSIVQPISLLFFLLLHLRASSRHFLFPSPSALPPFPHSAAVPLLIRPFCALLALSAENPSHPSSSSRIY